MNGSVVRLALAVTLVAALSVALVASGCSGASEETLVTVAAASSLRVGLSNYRPAPPAGQPKLSFAGSNELAAQIRNGSKPDVFAAADPEINQRLFRDGLVGRPKIFARNALVVAVPANTKTVTSFRDLYGDGVTIATGTGEVPIGRYARKAIAQLPAQHREALARNIRSTEPNVGGIVGKLMQRAVDAGFVYSSDVHASKGQLRAIDLPRAIRQRGSYSVAVVAGARRPRAARAYVDGLIGPSGDAALAAAGIEPVVGDGA